MINSIWSGSHLGNGVTSWKNPNWNSDTGQFGVNGMNMYSGSAGSSSAAGVAGMNVNNLISQIYGISASNNALMQQAAEQQRAWSSGEASIAREFNSVEAAKNRDWQKMMSDTAHQREVADLQAAGLNPVLSAMNGNGAAVGSGASASAVMPSGAEANVDTTANSALVNLLGHFLSAQTQLEAANISARTNEAVADKYNAMSEIVANINAATSMRNTDVSAAAGITNTQRAAAATEAAAAMAAAAAKYGYNLNAENIQKQLDQEIFKLENYPNNMYQLLDNFLNGANSSMTEIGTNVRQFSDVATSGVLSAISLGNKIGLSIKDIALSLKNSYSQFINWETGKIEDFVRAMIAGGNVSNSGRNR